MTGARQKPAVPRIALTRSEAAASLGVSVDFFDDHVEPELRSVKRGSRKIYGVAELQRWVDESADRMTVSRRR